MADKNLEIKKEFTEAIYKSYYGILINELNESPKDWKVEKRIAELGDLKYDTNKLIECVKAWVKKHDTLIAFFCNKDENGNAKIDKCLEKIVLRFSVLFNDEVADEYKTTLQSAQRQLELLGYGKEDELK